MPESCGAITFMKLIELTKDKVALVDDEDFERVNSFKWYANKSYTTDTWYAERTPIVDGKKVNVRMHRFILNITEGDKIIDHKDRNGLNNQKDNLRISNPSQNQANRSLTKNKTSKYKGVCWNKLRNKWRCSIMLNRKHISLGHFYSESQAALVYNKKAIELYGEFAHLNCVSCENS